jgi:peptidoglycan/LPS O-acetylase OafA/YrhL
LKIYFVRRFVRIGIPFLAVVAFERLSGPLVGDAVATAPRMVLWSLWCEMIYYAIYPALLAGFRRVGIAPILVVSFLVAYMVIFHHWNLMTYWDYSRTQAWIVAMPAWLLGCMLAEQLASGRQPVLPGSVWAWRAAALALSIPPKALVYRDISPTLIGNPATLGVFSIFAFFWIAKEISTFAERRPPAVLKWGGHWSYSLYLVHNVIIVALIPVVSQMSPVAGWPLELAAILIASYTFYRIVEYPAHILARWSGRRIAKSEGILRPKAISPVKAGI